MYDSQTCGCTPSRGVVCAMHTPKLINPAFAPPVVYPPVKCLDCGTWWRTATHKCDSGEETKWKK